MTKNQNITGQNSQNQKNAMSDDDLGDGSRRSKDLRGKGQGVPADVRTQGQGETGMSGREQQDRRDNQTKR